MDGANRGIPDGPGRAEVSGPAAVAAARIGWDRYADTYQAEHGGFLGAADFIWCPEGVNEATAGLLGPVADRDWLEVGCGAGPCGRWVIAGGGRVVGVDLSERQLRHALRSNDDTGIVLPVVQAHAGVLPLRDGAFDGAFSAFGALPFVADPGQVLRELHRVLRPAAPWVFSVLHPFRWTFPDDPGEAGLTANGSYFDRLPYVEFEAGRPVYVEYQRTIGDWVRLLNATGFRLADLLEPEWPAGHDRTWGGWSRLRGERFPGTAIFVTERSR